MLLDGHYENVCGRDHVVENHEITRPLASVTAAWRAIMLSFWVINGIVGHTKEEHCLQLLQLHGLHEVLADPLDINEKA
jgi:hypothetical protein